MFEPILDKGRIRGERRRLFMSENQKTEGSVSQALQCRANFLVHNVPEPVCIILRVLCEETQSIRRPEVGHHRQRPRVHPATRNREPRVRRPATAAMVKENFPSTVNRSPFAFTRC